MLKQDKDTENHGVWEVDKGREKEEAMEDRVHVTGELLRGREGFFPSLVLVVYRDLGRGFIVVWNSHQGQRIRGGLMHESRDLNRLTQTVCRVHFAVFPVGRQRGRCNTTVFKGRLIHVAVDIIAILLGLATFVSIRVVVCCSSLLVSNWCKRIVGLTRSSGGMSPRALVIVGRDKDGDS